MRQYDNAELYRARALYARTVKLHGKDHPDAIAARTALYEASLGRYIARTVAKVPTFTGDQRRRLAALLTGDAA